MSRRVLTSSSGGWRTKARKSRSLKRMKTRRNKRLKESNPPPRKRVRNKKARVKISRKIAMKKVRAKTMGR